MSEPRGFVVAPRFCGPPRSGNGGYVAGRLASFVEDGDGAEVTLRSPPPIGVRLEVTDADGGVHLLAGRQTLIAEAKPATLDGDAPAPVAFDEAVEAAPRYAGRRNHPFPTCFVCGPDRAPVTDFACNRARSKLPGSPRRGSRTSLFVVNTETA